MDQATLTWAVLVGVLAVAAAAGLAWRRSRQRRADATQHAAQAARALAQARNDTQRAARQAAQQAAARAAEQAAERAAEQAAEQASRKAAEDQAAAQVTARLQAEQTLREQAEQQAWQHARAQAERALATEAAETVEVARQAQIAAQATAAADARSPATTPRRPADTLVMVADDSKVVRVKTSRLLAQHGYRVVVAEDGAQAAQLIEAEVPAVLITDVEMPGLDGFALTRLVRNHPRAGRIPIIMITSADDRLKAAAADAGVTLVLGKPYPEEELIACIERSQATATA